MGSNQECRDPPKNVKKGGDASSLRLLRNQGCADFRPFTCP